MIRMFPERKDYLDDQISSFPLIVVSHRLGQAFSVKPFSKPMASVDYNEKLAYDHDLEVARPWYYSTYLIDCDVQVEFTPAKKQGYTGSAFLKRPRKPFCSIFITGAKDRGNLFLTGRSWLLKHITMMSWFTCTVFLAKGVKPDFRRLKGSDRAIG